MVLRDRWELGAGRDKGLVLFRPSSLGRAQVPTIADFGTQKKGSGSYGLGTYLLAWLVDAILHGDLKSRMQIWYAYIVGTSTP